MIKNFFEMPRYLKMLTLASFVVLVLALTKAFSGVGVFGENINISTWWRSGAGLAFILPALIMVISAILLLTRSRYGRFMYIGGWITLTMGAYIGARLAQAHTPMLDVGIAFNAGVTVCIALYLYFSKAVRAYFNLVPY